MSNHIQNSNVKELKKQLPNLQENVLLKNYTTFRIGGPARYFFIANTREDLVKAVSEAKKNNLPFFILGEGSNLLVADEGFDGIVIKCQMSKVKCQIKSKSQISKIYTDAGVRLSRLLVLAVKNNLTGLEWAAGIPGTIGGAVYGNAGLIKKPGQCIGELVEEVETLNNKLEVKKYKKRECKFGYRESIFKYNNEVILSVVLKLKKGDSKESQEIIKRVLKEREEKIPKECSAGCVFKNPKHFSAGWLIEKCGLKGKKIGDIKISEKHANFIVNLGRGEAKDVLKLINLVKKKVKEKFGIKLEEEIQFLGF